jgi:chromosome segregation protein
MYLKELEIFGFKSFPQKTILKFEPGITVIVGPNGCGKSNILDAIKWALGEQSPKSLRGSKMEDVIFNGTENHPPLSYTEVTLNFSNEDKYLPIEYKEVSVTRRLYRSGESQYLINKSQVRLKDIQDLFMGTGIGEATYSFVEQGKIEIFLSYKPEEKRLIFDEASGIVKYKERKKETLRKLEDTENNLLRLEDILSEVRRQIRYLERQVERARKYKELEGELVEVEKKIASLQCYEFEEKTNKCLEELNSFKKEEEEKAELLKEEKESYQDLTLNLEDIRKKIEDMNAAIISLSANIENSISSIEVLTKTKKGLEERNKNIENTKEEIKERLSLQEKRLVEEKMLLDSFEERVEKVTKEINGLKLKKDTLKKEIERLREEVKDKKIKILDWEAERVNIHNSLIEAQTNLSSLARRKQRLLLDKAKLEGFLKDSREHLERVEQDLKKRKERLVSLKKEKDNLSLQDKELIIRKEEREKELLEKEKELVELNSAYQFLKDLKIKYERFSSKKKITIIFEEEPKDINILIASLKDAEYKKRENFYEVNIDVKIVSLEEEQLEERIKMAHSKISQLRIEIDSFKRKKEEIFDLLVSKEKQIEEEQREYHKSAQEKENLDREWSRLNEEYQLLEKDTKNVLEEMKDLETKKKNLEEKLSFCEENLSSANQKLEEFQNTISKNLEIIKEIDINLAKKEEQGQSLYKERDVLNSKYNLLKEEKENLLKNLEALEKEKNENQVRIVSLKEEIENLNLRIEENKKKIEESKKQKEVLEKQEVFLSEEIKNKNDEIEETEKEIQQIRNFIYNKKLEIQSLEYEKDKIKNYLRQVYNVELDIIPKENIEEDLDSFCKKRDNLKKKKESLGEVNLVAIEEFEELKKREEFLENQKKDLIESKENLKKAIQKINQTSKELFLEAFNKIEEEFKKNFRFLFGGGRANLILLDRDNVLESGVEIEVQPPGKKLQNVSLLSGGEKALTAIALIFAIFRVRPSPICVLDEIDAPLDEVNVDRFNHLLKEFSSISQFILITHNKKTMSNADVLYGVTMQEKGVSKLVSVKFASEKALS